MFILHVFHILLPYEELKHFYIVHRVIWASCILIFIREKANIQVVLILQLEEGAGLLRQNTSFLYDLNVFLHLGQTYISFTFGYSLTAFIVRNPSVRSLSLMLLSWRILCIELPFSSLTDFFIVLDNVCLLSNVRWLASLKFSLVISFNHSVVLFFSVLIDFTMSGYYT